MLKKGELAILSTGDDRIIWISSNPEGPGTHVEIRDDGTLAIMNDDLVWTSSTPSEGTSPYTMTIRDDGNLVVQDAYDTLIWQTKTSDTKKLFLQ